MYKKVTLLQVILILSIILFNALHSKAECNVCSAINQMACVSETQYQFCIGNIPSGVITTCPTGYVCSTTTATICLPNTTGVTATCSQCNKCDSNLVFACTGVNTYALCFGLNTPSEIGGTCGSGQICTVNNPQICSTSPPDAATCPTGGGSGGSGGGGGGVVIPTTSSTSTTTRMPTTVPTYAQHFCQLMQRNTRFETPMEIDATCRRYIYCFLTREGTWSGQIYTCAGSTYFDPRSRYCVKRRPSTC